MENRIGIDLGGTKLEAMLTEDDPLKVIEKKRVPTERDKGYQFIINTIADLIKEFAAKCEKPPKIGMGIPGTISPKTGLVRNSNTQCLIGQPLKQDLEKLIKMPIVIENDANCFALSEAKFGAGQGHKVVMGIIMGTGMGGGLVIDGKLWAGSQGIAGEWGHSSINYQGPLCWCGQRGCLEKYISGTAAELEYSTITGNKIPLAEIYEKFVKNEVEAVKVINNLIFFFGRGLANLIASFDPDIVVIGGGVSHLPLLYTKGVDEIRHRIFNDELATPIVKNQLGDSSGIYGAALLADQ